MQKIRLNLLIESTSDKAFTQVQIDRLENFLNRQFQDATFHFENSNEGLDLKKGFTWRENSIISLTDWEQSFLSSAALKEIKSKKIDSNDRVRISRLRKKLPKNIKVKNQKGVGYRVVKI